MLMSVFSSKSSLGLLRAIIIVSPGIVIQKKANDQGFCFFFFPLYVLTALQPDELERTYCEEPFKRTAKKKKKEKKKKKVGWTEELLHTEV